MEERATLPRTASRFALGRRGRAAMQSMAEQAQQQFAEAARALAEAARVSADALTTGAQQICAAGCMHGILSASSRSNGDDSEDSGDGNDIAVGGCDSDGRGDGNDIPASSAGAAVQVGVQPAGSAGPVDSSVVQ